MDRARAAGIDLRLVASTAIVTVLVLVTLVTERSRPDAVAGYGVLDARGVAVATNVEGVEVGQPAPAFRLLDTDGQAVTLSDLTGAPVVLQFWTTWCLDCIDAIPVFQQISTSHVDDVVVLGIASNETGSRVEGALNRAGATYTALLDSDGVVANRYGARSVPYTVVIDGNGMVAAVHEGRVSVAQLESDLAALQP